MRCLFLALTLLIVPALAFAQDFKMEPPKSPADSLKCIKVRPGFKVELMIAEPLVMDPIAFAWGPDGKFWVVEMGDYPLGVDGKNKPGGRIKYLEKTRPDGPYDKMTVFMENIGYPTGVFPYGKGVLVTCAPDIFYAEAKTGKGRADTRINLFTGFKEGNQQHRLNGLTWGIDNWIYGANGDSGGVIKSIKTGKTVDIRGRDFRLKPDTGEFEAVSGQSQFGRCRDDWGNWFGNNNSNPMFHFVLDDQYLKRNPHVLYPDPKVNVSIKPGASQVFPISKPLARFNTPQALNHFTSACSTILYRDTLFGKEFEGNAFISEPVHNLIHREIMKPKGVTFTSQRADDEQTSEFLASSDNWFRPTMIQVGPDGALWIADMYRYVIEHPEWIPKDWQKKLDLRAGHDLGRIYRVVPVDAKPREIVRMDKMNDEELVMHFESPNGWVRDMAHQLLVKRQRTSKEAEQIQKMLRMLVVRSPVAQARLHCLYADQGDNSYIIKKMIQDPHPAIRKHSIALAERDRLLALDDVLNRLSQDSSPEVRLQLAYSLDGGGIFAYLLCKNADNPYIVAAALSSINKLNFESTLSQLLMQESIPANLFAPMTRLASALGTPRDVAKIAVRQTVIQGKQPNISLLDSVGQMLEALDAKEMSLNKLLDGGNISDIKATYAQMKDLQTFAMQVVGNPMSSIKEKVIAIRLLDRGFANDRDDQKTLLTFLTPQNSDEMQTAALRQLSRTFDPRVPGLLLSPWKSYSPNMRGQVLDIMLSRPIWTTMTLDTIKKKQILAQEIDAVRRQRFLQHKSAEIRTTAKELFASASNPDRRKVADLYWLQLPAKGDAAKGAKLFAKACATCHKLGDVGQNVGPDFAAIGDKSPQGLLTAILDPNRAVEARYINYVASTKKGLILTGILTSETSTSITLTANDGKQHQLLRNEIDELSSTGQSMMPEGLEKDLSPQDLADIIEHIRSALPKKTGKIMGGEPSRVSGRVEHPAIWRHNPAAYAARLANPP